MTELATAVVRPVEWEHPAATALRDEQRIEIDSRYGGEDTEPGPKPSGADIAVFLVAFVGDDAAGCGGLRAIDDEHGEIKRMFVRPAYRGRGVAVAILRALEDDARARGWSRLVLETGTGQPDAVRFYEREGYRRIPAFGYYADSPLSLCYETVL